MKFSIKSIFQLALVISVCNTALPAFAQEMLEEVYTVPTAASPVMPQYPSNELNNGQEAVLHVNFMVDEEGKVFDAMVTKSTGSRNFDSYALKALNRTRFQPAMLNGEPITGSAAYKYIFTIPEAKGASMKFIRAYEKFNKAMEEQNQNDIEELLAALVKVGANNHYEHAFMNLAQYRHAELYGESLLRMEYLHGALSWSDSADDPVYFPDETVIGMRRTLLVLQMQNREFAEAMDTYDLLLQGGDTEAENLYGKAVAAALELKENDTQYPLSYTLDSNGSIWLKLFKDEIGFVAAEAELDEIKLRCEQHYVAFKVETDVMYEVPRDWGACSLEVLGKANTGFTLIQK